MTPGSEAYQETYDLFVAVWEAGQELLDAGTEPAALPAACRAVKDYFTATPFDTPGALDRTPITADPDYVIRAWMAVVSYLLSDASFLLQ